MSDPNQPATATTLTVSDSNALLAALNGANSGDTILLAPGTYAPINLNGFNFSGTVTIQSADTSHEAVLTGLKIVNSSGLAINNVDLPVAGYSSTGVSVAHSTNISLSGLMVHGTSGEDVGLGAMVRYSTGVTISNSDFTQMGSGISQLTNHDVAFTNNSFHDLEVDGIVGGGSVGVTVTGNHFETFHPKPGDHPDAIQFFATEGIHGDHVTISDNVIVRGAGEVYQGIFIENTNNVTITGNAVEGTMYNGIALARTDTALISDNFVQGFTDMGTRIIVRGGSSNVTVTHNVAESLVNYQDGGQPNPNYLASDNTSIAATTASDLSALNDWLAQHAQSAVDGITAPVTGVVPPIVTGAVDPVLGTPGTTPMWPGFPNLPTAGPGAPGQAVNLSVTVEHAIHDMIANQIASSGNNGWAIF